MIPCTVCGQQLYPLERMTLNSKAFHKQGCARCSTCNTNLNINNFAMAGEKLYCKTHYLSNFQRSGGRYSFDGTDKTSQHQTPVKDSARTQEVRASARQEQPKFTPTPAKQHASSTATPAPNRLSAFLSSGASSSSAPEPATASKPAVPSSVKVPAQPTPASTPQKPAHATASATVPPSTNKLAAFLSNPATVATTTPSRQDVKPSSVENARPNNSTPASKPAFEAAPASSVRPVSLKERLDAYAAEVSGAKKPVENKPTNANLPPLPKKDKMLEAQYRSLPEEKEAPRHVSIVTPAKQNETPSRAGQGENRLSAFLKQVEPTPAPIARSTLATGSVTSRDEKANVNDEDAQSRSRPLSLRERIAAYSAEATRTEPQPAKPAPQLPPAKPSYDKVLSMSPKKSSASSGFTSRSDSATTKASIATPTSPTRGGSGETRPMSLKERIASYQAKASGLGNGRFRSPTRKSSGDKSIVRESPTKKTGLRSRFPFLKSPVYASPTMKASELHRVAVKVCDEGLSQLTRTSMKHRDAEPQLVSVIAELKIALESSLKQLRLLENEAQQRTIPH